MKRDDKDFLIKQLLEENIRLREENSLLKSQLSQDRQDIDALLFDSD